MLRNPVCVGCNPIGWELFQPYANGWILSAPDLVGLCAFPQTMKVYGCGHPPKDGFGPNRESLLTSSTTAQLIGSTCSLP